MKAAVFLIAVMLMMINQTTDAWWVRVRYRLTKREVGDADFQAKFNAAAEDGVFDDGEIKSVFGIDDNGLTDFIATYDMNGDGKVQVKEYEAVTTLAENMQS